MKSKNDQSNDGRNGHTQTNTRTKLVAISD